VAATVAQRWPWWLSPATVVLVLGSFAVYATWAVVFGHGTHEFKNYLSPFYSPYLGGLKLPFSPAILIMWVPLGFRLTCYYYRKAYYRSFFWDPPACARGELRSETYHGETRFPFILQNLHRYFFYGSLVVWLFLAADTVQAFLFDGQFGIRLGSLIFLANIVLLGLYTFSCHSWRHLIGGNLDCFSCSMAAKLRHGAWERVSLLNQNHMLWAWTSLFSVSLADLYVRLLVAGILIDPKLF
jgi:hypothetical protein